MLAQYFKWVTCDDIYFFLFFSVLILWFICTNHDIIIYYKFYITLCNISFVKLNVWWDACLFLLVFGWFSGVWSILLTAVVCLEMSDVICCFPYQLLFFSCSSSLSLTSHFLNSLPTLCVSNSPGLFAPTNWKEQHRNKERMKGVCLPAPERG